MKLLPVIENEVFGEAITSLRNGSVLVRVDLLVFDRTPRALDKDVVKDPATAIRVAPDIVFLQLPVKLTAGKLTPSISVEDLGLRCRQGLFQGRETELVSMVVEIFHDSTERLCLSIMPPGRHIHGASGQRRYPHTRPHQDGCRLSYTCALA